MLECFIGSDFSHRHLLLDAIELINEFTQACLLVLSAGGWIQDLLHLRDLVFFLGSGDFLIKTDEDILATGPDSSGLD